MSRSLLTMDPVKLTEMVDRGGLFDLKGILPEEGYSLLGIAVNNPKTDATKGSCSNAWDKKLGRKNASASVESCKIRRK